MKKTNKNMNASMGMGMCFGIAIGAIVGSNKDKAGERKEITVTAGVKDTEFFSVGDVVF